MIIKCFQCEKSLHRNLSHVKRVKHNFCSKSCHDIWQRSVSNSRIISCKNCGKKAKVWFSRPSKNNFCSSKCFYDYNRGENNPKWRPKIERVCKICKKRYNVSSSRKESVVCSIKCRKLWEKISRPSGKDSPHHKPKVLKMCINCGSHFDAYPYRADERRFCSRYCYGKWISNNLVGKDAPHWKGGHIPYYGPNWKVQRRKALYRDNNECTLCRVKKGARGRALSIHHIRPFREFEDYVEANKLKNLITVCDDCHNILERGGGVLCS